MTTVVIVDEADEQLGEIVTWWKANRRAAPTLPTDELERCVTLLAAAPDVGLAFHRSKIPGVRRILLRRTKLYVYYVHDATNAIIYVIAVWGAVKGSDPLLHDPR